MALRVSQRAAEVPADAPVDALPVVPVSVVLSETGSLTPERSLASSNTHQQSFGNIEAVASASCTAFSQVGDR